LKDIDVLAWMINGLSACSAKFFKRSKPFYRREVWKHYASVGAGSLAIVSTISACTGIILALQAAKQLEKVGALSYVANLVGYSLVTELGPLLTAIILAGKAGAAFTAEIAAMKINQEVDALNVMGIDPLQYLVWPKMSAMILMMPLLTAWADFVGIGSSLIFCALVLDINPADYYEQTVVFISVSDFFSGLVKSLGFGFAITIICCWQGFLAREGAGDVGKRTTTSVVLSIFVIILLDLLFTSLNYVFA
jgi:phospholipid/cholesterol/gamma-HCH transport system permease protein